MIAWPFAFIMSGLIAFALLGASFVSTCRDSGHTIEQCSTALRERINQ